MHSTTKYLGGHGDVMAGVVVTSAENRRKLYELNKLVGGVLGPFEAWLAMRGCKTLPLRVCQQCQHHFRLTINERLALLTDPQSFVVIDASLRPGNPLDFPEYEQKLASDRVKTGRDEAFIYGDATLEGVPMVFGVAEFAFRGASMGSVYGEKVARALERGAEMQRPVVLVTASGGARMQEGIVSLMQMAKTSAACARLRASGQLYIVVMTDPTTAGVLASFASLGDIILAEPGALIGFAGPRVIEQNLKIKLPPGTHTAEFQLAHGMVDMVVHRRDQRGVVAKLLKHLAPGSTMPEMTGDAVASAQG
jgi:acetyl-CoA carboxylase carboxyl transferase subunit beta